MRFGRFHRAAARPLFGTSAEMALERTEPRTQD